MSSESEKIVGESVSNMTGVEYVPEADAVIDWDKFQAQMTIPQLERAVIDAAIRFNELGGYYDDLPDNVAAESDLMVAVEALLKARGD